jgi:hypothetical protein
MEELSEIKEVLVAKADKTDLERLDFLKTNKIDSE